MIKRFLITVQQTRNAHRRLSNTNLAMLIAYLCYCLRNIYLNNGTANISFASAVVVNRDRLNDIHIALWTYIYGHGLKFSLLFEGVSLFRVDSGPMSNMQ